MSGNDWRKKYVFSLWQVELKRRVAEKEGLVLVVYLSAADMK